MSAVTSEKYSYHFESLGRPIIQYPQDIVAMQELIWVVKPDLIAASILEDAYEFCSIFIDAAKKEFNIPIAVGGVTPTISPSVVMEHPKLGIDVDTQKLVPEDAAIRVSLASNITELAEKIVYLGKNHNIRKSLSIRAKEVADKIIPDWDSRINNELIMLENLLIKIW